MDKTQHKAQAGHCHNCRAPLQGDFCSQCGQRDWGRDMRLRDHLAEAAEDLTDVDSRIWRTLAALLFQPGRVSAEYFAGRRARYMPPLRLYLVVSFLVFLVMSVGGGSSVITTDPGFDGEALELREDGIYFSTTAEDGKTEVLSLRDYLEREGLLDNENEELPGWLQEPAEKFVANVYAISEDPGDFLSQLVQRLPQVMFLLLPLFALLLWAFNPGSGFHYLQHLIFSVHYHTAAFLFYLLLLPLKLVLPADYGGVIMLVLTIYLPIALRRVFGGGLGAAIAKGLVISFVYYFMVLTAGALYVVMTLALL